MGFPLSKEPNAFIWCRIFVIYPWNWEHFIPVGPGEWCTPYQLVHLNINGAVCSLAILHCNYFTARFLLPQSLKYCSVAYTVWINCLSVKFPGIISNLKSVLLVWFHILVPVPLSPWLCCFLLGCHIDLCLSATIMRLGKFPGLQAYGGIVSPAHHKNDTNLL